MSLVGDPPAEPITLSALEFDVLWEHLRLPPMPVVFAVPSPGSTEGERARLVRQAWDGIEARGLGRPVGLHPQLAGYLQLISRPEVEVDARLWVGGETRVLAAAAAGQAVLVTLTGQRLTFRQASPEGLPHAVLGELPEQPAGPGLSVTLPSADFEAAAQLAGESRERFALELSERGVRQGDVDTLVEMISDVTGQGQFGAAARDRFGRRHRADRAVSFFDTGAGRYMHVKRAEPGMPPWTTISPVDHRRLLQHIGQLAADVGSTAGR